MSLEYLKDNYTFPKPVFCNRNTGREWERDGYYRHYFYPMFVQAMVGMDITYGSAESNGFIIPIVRLKGKKYTGKNAIKLVESVNKTYYDLVEGKLIAHPLYKDELLIKLISFK